MSPARGRTRNAFGPGEASPRAGEIYIEFFRYGAQLRAVAVDAATGIEVTVFGPSHVPQDELGRLAVRKLYRRLEREA